MFEMNSFDNIYLILVLIVPGLIIVFVRAQFLRGQNSPHSEAILSYFTLSVFYYVLMLPIVNALFGVDKLLDFEDVDFGKFFGWVLIIFLGPALFGALLGVSAQKGYLRRFANSMGIYPVHATPTAWDWKFSSPEESWVLVTLQDNTKFAGLCGANSFISSDPNERDIFIEKLYNLTDDDKWQDCGSKSVLITAGEIKTIEFWPAYQGETKDANEQ